MTKNLSYEERFEKFKKDYFSPNPTRELQQFLVKYYKFKEIEEGLIKEKKKQFEDRNG